MARILIVDDQKSVLITLEALLAKDKHYVASCLNASDALAKLQAETFDLLVTDAIMPGGETGYALIRTIRSHPKLANLPVILVTGKREKEDVERGLLAGTDDYVVKPVDPDIFLAKVRSLLDKHQKSAPNFLEAPVRAKGEWETKTEILAVSELGLTLQSNAQFPAGQRTRLQTTLFNEIGIPNPMLRIASCEPVGTDGFFKIQAHFIGLSEKELQPLRLWIRSKRG